MKSADRVFSSGGLDAGTKVLLDEVPEPPEEGTFLDLGCGWGPIAAVMGTESPASTIWAVDVSERALDLTEKNMTRLGLANVTALTEQQAIARAEQEGTRFDLIWSNPPVRVGKAALQQIVGQWLGRLAPDGEAYLVISKNLGADSAARWLSQNGYRVERIASKRGFRVLRVRNGV